MGQRERERSGCIVAAPFTAGAPFLRLAVILLLLAGWMSSRALAIEIHAEVEINGQNQMTTLPNPLGYIQEHLVADGGVADAQVGLGWMRLNAFMGGSVIQTTPQIVVEGGSLALGWWTDMVTITPVKASLLSTPGTATFVMRLDGFVSADGNIGAGAQATYSDAGARVQINGTPVFGVSTQFPDVSGGQYIDELIEFDVNIIFGQPFPLAVQMEATASVSFDFDFIRLGDAGFGETDLSDTLEWQGVVRIEDELGEEVTEYDMTSDSGTDYRNAIQAPPVPEPGAAVLLGLSCVAMLRRRAARA